MAMTIPQIGELLAGANQEIHLTGKEYALLFGLMGLMDATGEVGFTVRGLGQRTRNNTVAICSGLRKLEAMGLVTRLSKPKSRIRLQVNREVVGKLCWGGWWL
jgi:hypothetical protein